MPEQDDDPAAEWEDEATIAARTRLDAQPLGLASEDTPPRPVELFAGYDAGKAEGRREGRVEGIYEVIRDLRAVLVAGKNNPAFIEHVTRLLTVRRGLKWPPPPGSGE